MSDYEKVILEAPSHRERRAAGRFTGRYLLTTEPEGSGEVASRLEGMGMSAATPIAAQGRPVRALPPGQHIELPNIGVVLVDPLPEREGDVLAMAEENDAVIGMEPERINTAYVDSAQYVAGWRDAIAALTGKLLGDSGADQTAVIEAAATGAVTWGLQACAASTSSRTGKGIKLAVLDTGLDMSHPDFAGRKITVRNFVGDNTPFHDGQGHGTHCLGTAAGPRQPSTGPRYGVAYEAELFAGRVLDDNGRGGDFNILQAIEWAVGAGCQVISLSLGAPWMPGDRPYSQAYETAARRALAVGSLLVVAAGNEANKP